MRAEPNITNGVHDPLSLELHQGMDVFGQNADRPRPVYCSRILDLHAALFGALLGAAVLLPSNIGLFST